MEVDSEKVRLLMNEIIDRFDNLSEEHRDSILVRLFCHEAHRMGRSVISQLLHMVRGLSSYLGFGLNTKKLTDVEHKEGIGMVQWFYKAISECNSEDEKA